MLVVGVPVADVTRADASGDGIPIAVTVLPTAPTGTVSALLTGGAPIAWGAGPHRLAMGLRIVDNRPEPGGWEITVSQRARPGTSDTLWLFDIGAHPPELAEWSLTAPRHLSAGQPLSRPTVILATAPGGVPSVSWAQLVFIAPLGAVSASHRMLVTIASAP